MEIKDLLVQKCIYKKDTHSILLFNNGELEAMIDIRCWGKSNDIQDEFGNFVADAINEKIKLNK